MKKESMSACELNKILEKPLEILTTQERQVLIQELISRMMIEYRKKDRSGIYAKTQTEMAYNSNKIEGSTLTPEQTDSLFTTGTLRSDGEIVYKAKDIEEMTGHFSMFNYMLKTCREPLTETLIKKYHYYLKIGVFEDRANGYPIGEYKNRVNYISDIQVAKPSQVSVYIQELLRRYERISQVNVYDLARFHADFEKIHPFQDGNGRTGRMILFKECLRTYNVPVIIRDQDKELYYHSLNKAQKNNDYEGLTNYIMKEQKYYFDKLKEFLWNYSGNHGLKEDYGEKNTDFDTFFSLDKKNI